MWDPEPDMFDDMDEPDFEHESMGDMTDFGMDSDMGVLSDGEAFDEYSSYFNDDDED